MRPQIQAFDPNNKEHKFIVLGAMAAADALGVGRITAAKEQLELNNIVVRNNAQFHQCICEWGKDFS